MLSFRNYFEAKEPISTPDWFYVACKLNKQVLEKSPKTPEGAVATLFNLEGITDKFSSFESFLDQSLFGIKMPGKETLELNKLSKIDYDNLDYLASRGFRAARRVETGLGKRDPLEITFKKLLVSFFQNHLGKIDILRNSVGNNYYLLNTSLTIDDIIEYLKGYNPYQKNAFWKKTPKKSQIKSKDNLKNFNNFNELAIKLFKLLKIHLPELELTQKDISYGLQKAFRDSHSFDSNKSESEWVTKRQPQKFNVKIGDQKSDLNLNINQLHVPEGSTIYIDVNKTARDKNVKDLFPEIKDFDKLKSKIIEKLQKKYNVLEINSSSGLSVKKSDFIRNDKEKEDESKIIDLLNNKESYTVNNFYRVAKLKNVDRLSVSKILKHLINNHSIFIQDNVIKKNDDLIKNISVEEKFLQTLKETTFNFLTIRDVENDFNYGKETLKSILNNLRKEKKIVIKNKIIFPAEIKSYPANEKIEKEILESLGKQGNIGISKTIAQSLWKDNFKLFTKLLYENKIVFFDAFDAFYSIDDKLKNSSDISSIINDLKQDASFPLFKIRNNLDLVQLLRTGLVFDDGKNMYLKSNKFKNPFFEKAPLTKVQKQILDVIKKYLVTGFSSISHYIENVDSYLLRDTWDDLRSSNELQRRVSKKNGDPLNYYVSDEDYDYMKKPEVKKFMDLMKEKKILNQSKLDQFDQYELQNILYTLKSDDVIFSVGYNHIALSEYKNDKEVLDFIKNLKDENFNNIKKSIKDYNEKHLQPFTAYDIAYFANIGESEVEELLPKIENIKQWGNYFWTNDIDTKDLDQQIMNYAKENVLFSNVDISNHLHAENDSKMNHNFIRAYGEDIIKKNEILSKFVKTGYNTYIAKENYIKLIKENKDLISLLDKFIVSTKYIANYLKKDLKETQERLIYLSGLDIIKSGGCQFTSGQFFWRKEIKFNRYIELIEMIKSELMSGPVEYEDLLNRLSKKTEKGFFSLLNLINGNLDKFNVVTEYPKITISLK